jgi:hypothetical protein
MSTELTTLESLDMDEVQQSVQKHELALEQMKADYLPLLDTPIADKKQLEVVKAARMNFKNTRLEGVQRLDAGCKALYANWKLWVKARDAFEKKFSDEEAKFREKEKVFEEAEERRFLEIAKEEQRRVAARKERMFQIGFRFNGSKYILEGFAELTENEVSGLGVDDLQLGEWLNDLERQVAEHKERQEEEERTRRIAAEAQAAAQKAEADRIAAAQAELERKQREMDAREAQMNARVYVERRKQVDDLRLVFAGEGAIWLNAETRVALDDLASVPQEQWDAYVVHATETRRLRDIELEKIRVQEEQERIAREEQLKAEAAQKAVEAERSRLAAEAEAKKKQEELLAQQAAEKALQASDKEKVESLAHIIYCEFLEIGLPELKSAIGQAAMRSYTKQLMDIHASMVKLSKEL